MYRTNIQRTNVRARDFWWHLLHIAVPSVTGLMRNSTGCDPFAPMGWTLDQRRQLTIAPANPLATVANGAAPRTTPGPGGGRASQLIHFHFTPTGASWMNMVEAWFGILTRKSIRRGSFYTVRALVRHITHYINHWNQDSTPFVWAKEPADIIRKAVRRQHDFVDGTLGAGELSCR